MAEDRWLSVAEIAEHLGVTKDSIYDWLTSKGLPGHKVGRLWRFKVDEVDEWVRLGKAAQEEPDPPVQAKPATPRKRRP